MQRVSTFAAADCFSASRNRLLNTNDVYPFKKKKKRHCENKNWGSLRNGASSWQPTCKISVVLTGSSCVCRSFRSKTPCRLDRVCLLCQRSAAEEDGEKSSLLPSEKNFSLHCTGAAEIKFCRMPKVLVNFLRAASHLAVSVSAHSARVVSPVHHQVVLVAAPVPVVKVLVAILAAEVRAGVSVIHGHAFINPVVFPGAPTQHSDRQDDGGSPRLALSLTTPPRYL